MSRRVACLGEGGVSEILPSLLVAWHPGAKVVSEYTWFDQHNGSLMTVKEKSRRKLFGKFWKRKSRSYVKVKTYNPESAEGGGSVAESFKNGDALALEFVRGTEGAQETASSKPTTNASAPVIAARHYPGYYLGCCGPRYK